MKAFCRIVTLAVILLLTLTLSFGGGRDANSFGFVGLLLLMFWGLPMVVVIAILHAVERGTGPRGRNVIAFLGLIPLLLFPFVQHHDPSFASIFLVPGIVWFFGWLVTSAIWVAEREHRAGT